MDGLALLCNLYADGPVTLERLRTARVANLAELERADPERLAAWLHASVPQARAFVEEARKLVRRLAEAVPPPLAVPPRAGVRSDSSAGRRPASAGSAAPSASMGPDPGLLRPGLLPGLDETVCARLALNHVRSVQALSESAGLTLARRTGIPYSALLDLSRHARAALAGRKDPGEARSAPALAEVELVPFVSQPRRAPAERELAPSDEFTLPLVEPESAGPFG